MPTIWEEENTPQIRREDCHGLRPKNWWKGASVHHERFGAGVLQSFDTDADQAICYYYVSCRCELTPLSELTLDPNYVYLHGPPELEEPMGTSSSSSAGI